MKLSILNESSRETKKRHLSLHKHRDGLLSLASGRICGHPIVRDLYLFINNYRVRAVAVVSFIRLIGGRVCLLMAIVPLHAA